MASASSTTPSSRSRKRCQHLRGVRLAREPADDGGDRVNGPAADGGREVVSELLDAQGTLDDLRIVAASGKTLADRTIVGSGEDVEVRAWFCR